MDTTLKRMISYEIFKFFTNIIKSYQFVEFNLD
jgi:hypothetical protein